MKTITAQTGQTVYDLALQEMGSIEGVFDIMAENAFIRPDMALAAGTKVFVPEKVYNAAVVDYYTRNNIHPASGLGEAISLNQDDMINITQEVAYNLAGGNKTFDGVRLANLGDELTVQINHTDVVGTVTVHVEQSLDGEAYSAIPNTSGNLVPEDPSKTFNINDLVTNFVRIRIVATDCTGSIDKIIWRV